MQEITLLEELVYESSIWIVDNQWDFTIYFLCIIGAVFVVLTFWQQLPKSLLMTLGILGTFIGLGAGLHDFDTTNMDNSIIKLIDGLKIAFLTSIAGIASSIILEPMRIVINYLLDKPKPQDDVEIYLQQITHNVKKLNEDTNYNHRELKKSFDEFANKVASASTDAIIDALQDVVKNFNEKITEQFGEHFKHLNEAVEKLVIWQQEYKEYLDSFRQNLDLANNAMQRNTQIMEEVSQTMQYMAEKTSELPNNLQIIEDIIKQQSQQTLELVDNYKSLADIKEKANEAIPELEQKLSNLVENHMRRTETEVNKMVDNFSSNVEQAITISQAKQQELSDNVNDMQSKMQQQLDNATSNIEQAMINAFQTSDENIKQQIKDIIEQMGTELTSISGHLADDYREFQQSFQEIVNDIKQYNDNNNR